MTVVSGDDDALDPRRGQLADGTGQVAHHAVHHLAGEEVAVHLAHVVDLLGADEHQRGVADKPRELRRRGGQELAEGHLDQPRHSRLQELEPLRPAGQDGAVDAGGQAPLLVHHREARRGPREECRHAHWGDRRQRGDRGAHRQVPHLLELLGEFRAHLKAQRVDQEEGNPPARRLDHLRVDPGLREHADNAPARGLERLREAIRHALQEFLVLAAYDGEGLLGHGLVVHPRDPGLDPALQAVGLVPAGRRRVGRDPLRGVGSHPVQGWPDARDLATELRHQPARLPLGLAGDEAIDPEAVPALRDDRERLVVVLRCDERRGVAEKSVLLEAERVDRSQVRGIDGRLGEVEVLLDPIGEAEVGLGELPA